MGSSLFGFGFEYFFDRALIDTGETSFSLDWISRGLNGDKGNMFPMMINQRFYLDDINSTPMGERSYAYAGVGVAVMDVFTGTDTELAARVGYGRELGLHTYIEATTFWSDAGSGARATSTGLYIGYRF
jgi:hypothetical protein